MALIEATEEKDECLARQLEDFGPSHRAILAKLASSQLQPINSQKLAFVS
jgi:hypothetical protein